MELTLYKPKRNCSQPHRNCTVPGLNMLLPCNRIIRAVKMEMIILRAPVLVKDECGPSVKTVAVQKPWP